MFNKAIVRHAAKHILAIMEECAYGAECDAGFDAGEWSGPAHARIQDARLRAVYAGLCDADAVATESAVMYLMHEGYGRVLVDNYLESAARQLARKQALGADHIWLTAHTLRVKVQP